jgi:predicted nucleic-acid-binding protein
MIALDTNVLVRLVVDDDPDQTRRARKIIKRGDVLVSATVLLEAAWVLASTYGRDRAQVSAALRGILGLDGVATDMPATVAQALDWFDAGLDFADALHVAGAGRADSFATFDERLVRNARRAGIASVSVVPR